MEHLPMRDKIAAYNHCFTGIQLGNLHSGLPPHLNTASTYTSRYN